MVQEASVWLFLDLRFNFHLEFRQCKFTNLPSYFFLNKLNFLYCLNKAFSLILMYFNIDYNCFVNHLYHKTQIICKKEATCKKKQGDVNFALESREGDFSWYRARTLPTSPGLVSPASMITTKVFELDSCPLHDELNTTYCDNVRLVTLLVAFIYKYNGSPWYSWNIV